MHQWKEVTLDEIADLTVGFVGKRGAQTGTNNNKFQRCKTKDKGTRKSRQHILYLLCFNCGTR